MFILNWIYVLNIFNIIDGNKIADETAQSIVKLFKNDTTITSLSLSNSSSK
jgi:hypothetical protein